MSIMDQATQNAHNWPLIKQRPNVFTGWRQRSKYNRAVRALPVLEAVRHHDGTVSFPSDPERLYVVGQGGALVRLTPKHGRDWSPTLQ